MKTCFHGLVHAGPERLEHAVEGQQRHEDEHAALRPLVHGDRGRDQDREPENPEPRARTSPRRASTTTPTTNMLGSAIIRGRDPRSACIARDCTGATAPIGVVRSLPARLAPHQRAVDLHDRAAFSSQVSAFGGGAGRAGDDGRAAVAAPTIARRQASGSSHVDVPDERRARRPPRRAPDRCWRSPARRTSAPRAAGSRSPPRASGTARRSRARSTTAAPRRRRRAARPRCPRARARRGAASSRRCAARDCRAPRAGSPAAVRGHVGPDVEQQADVLARCEVADDEREPGVGEARRPAPGAASRSVAAHAVRRDDGLRRPTRGSSVAQPVARRGADRDEPGRPGSSDVRYWRGSSSRFASADSCARVIVITSWTVSTVGSASRGTRCLVPCTSCAPACANSAPARVAAPRARCASWPRVGDDEHRCRGCRRRARCTSAAARRGRGDDQADVVAAGAARRRAPSV